MIVRSLKLATAALALSGAVSAWAGVAVPVGCEGPGPSVSIAVDGSDDIDPICLRFGEDGKTFGVEFSADANRADEILATLAGSFSGNSDPFFDFSLGLHNFTRSDLTISVTFASPYVGGTYDTMSSQFILAVVDDDRIPGVTVAPTAGSILTVGLDGAALAGLAQGDGCTLPASGLCDPNTLLTTTVASLAAGTFSSTVSFTLSGLDTANVEGRIALFNQPVGVPAPDALAMLGASLFGLGLFRRRRLV